MPNHWLGAHAAIHFIQHWFSLPDLACEEALYDSASLRPLVGIDLGREPVPDATTMLKFRRLLNDNKLGEARFAKVGQELQTRGFKVNTGTIVDATIIGAPSSTKNADKARDPEMHQTRKGLVDEVLKRKNRNKSRIRSRVEHVFGVVKRLWGFGKVRYRGLAMNATRAFTALAQVNINLGRQRLMAQVRP